MEDFINAIENNPELQEKIIAVSTCQDLVNIAVSAGYNLTAEEVQANLITSFDELVIQLDNAASISPRYTRIYLAQIVDSICFSS
ncbi:MAG: Nif11-like leader peptide family natural product precursor [Cyanobacteria bacterium J06592_8]